MSQTNFTDIVYLREIIRERGRAFEDHFLFMLPSDIRPLYLNADFPVWGPTDSFAAIYECASQALFPNDDDRYLKTGKAVGTKTYKGAYRLFIRLFDLEYVIKRASNVWNTYHDKGRVSVQYEGKNRFGFVLSGYPSHPRILNAVVSGHLSAIVEITGKKNVKIEHVDSDPNAWKWIVTWDDA